MSVAPRPAASALGDRPVRVAVVGVGHLGQHHARIYRELPGVELVGVVDQSAARCREIADRHGVMALDDARLLIGRVDAASVATPTDSHFAVASRLLEAGIDLLVEKPLCSSAEDARRLCGIARAHGRRLQVGHVERFNPAIRAVRGLLRDPRFIACDRVSPFSFRSVDIGVVMDLMIHDLDIVLHLCDEPIESIEAMGIPILNRTEDVAHARLRFDSGATALLTASRVSTKRERRIRIFQKDCYISIDYGARIARVFRLRPELQAGLDSVTDIDPTLPADELQALVFSRFLEMDQLSMEGEPLKLELESFVDAVRHGTEPEVNGEAGLRAIEIADRIQAAMAAYLDQERARIASRPPAPT